MSHLTRRGLLAGAAALAASPAFASAPLAGKQAPASIATRLAITN